MKANLLHEHPGVQPALRMSVCPPIAVDRLVGLASVSKNLVGCMEEGKLPSRMPAATLHSELEKIAAIMEKMADPDIFMRLQLRRDPTDEIHRAATVVADGLCGAAANPIIRNAQEKRQLSRELMGVVQRGSVSWQLGRQRGRWDCKVRMAVCAG